MRKRRGFALIELLLVAAVAGLLGGLLGGRMQGDRFSVLCASICFALGLLGIEALAVTIGAIVDLVHRWRPPLPPCHEGRCDHWDYGMSLEEPDPDVLQCRCGHRYRRRGERFVRVLSAEVELAYMTRDARGRWRPEPRRWA